MLSYIKEIFPSLKKLEKKAHSFLRKEANLEQNKKSSQEIFDEIITKHKISKEKFLLIRDREIWLHNKGFETFHDKIEDIIKELIPLMIPQIKKEQLTSEPIKGLVYDDDDEKGEKDLLHTRLKELQLAMMMNEVTNFNNNKKKNIDLNVKIAQEKIYKLINNLNQYLTQLKKDQYNLRTQLKTFKKAPPPQKKELQIINTIPRKKFIYQIKIEDKACIILNQTYQIMINFATELLLDWKGRQHECENFGKITYISNDVSKIFYELVLQMRKLKLFEEELSHSFNNNQTIVKIFNEKNPFYYPD